MLCCLSVHGSTQLAGWTGASATCSLAPHSEADVSGTTAQHSFPETQSSLADMLPPQMLSIQQPKSTHQPSCRQKVPARHPDDRPLLWLCGGCQQGHWPTDTGAGTSRVPDKVFRQPLHRSLPNTGRRCTVRRDPLLVLALKNTKPCLQPQAADSCSCCFRPPLRLGALLLHLCTLVPVMRTVDRDVWYWLVDGVPPPVIAGAWRRQCMHDCWVLQGCTALCRRAPRTPASCTR